MSLTADSKQPDLRRNRSIILHSLSRFVLFGSSAFIREIKY